MQDDLPPHTADPQRQEAGLPGIGVTLVLLLGLGLRTLQFVAGVDMWHDELAVARNVEERSLTELITQPLDHRQVAPVGFLAAVDLSTDLLGFDELGFRLCSFLLGLLSLLLFWRIAQRYARGIPLLAALALFAVSPALVWYSSSVKPYGGDVTCSLLLVWLTVRFLERPDDMRRAVVAGVIGGASFLFSFPAVLTGAILGVCLVVAWCVRRPGAPIRPLATLGATWIVCAGTASVWAKSLLATDTDEFMRSFWAADFPPAGGAGEAIAWLVERIQDTFTHFLIFVPAGDPVARTLVTIPLLLALIGALALFRGRRTHIALLLAPLAAATAGAFAQLLPFDSRLGLHAMWGFLVLAAAALTALEAQVNGKWRLLPRSIAIFVALPLVAMVLVVARPPYEFARETAPRAVLEDLAQRLQADDSIYVYTQGRHDMAYYGTRAGIDDWLQGERHHDNPRGYLREVDSLRGNPRVWFYWVRLDGNEPSMIIRYFEAIGRQIERIPDSEEPASQTGAVLFDLSDPERLSQVTADTFELPDQPDPAREMKTRQR